MSVPRTRAVLMLFALLSTAQAGRAASEFDRFRIPDHHWSAWTFSAAGAAQKDRSDGNGGSFANRTAFAEANNQFAWGFDSDPAQHRLSLTTRFNGERSNMWRSAEDLGRTVQRRRDALESVDILCAGARFPWSLPVGVGYALRYTSAFFQVWRSSADVLNDGTHRVADEQTRSNTHNLEFAGGPQFGRVRDATPVHQVAILEDRLTRDHRLTRPLADATRSRLAAWYVTREHISFAHDRRERWFWREVERMLREDGALVPDGLDAGSLMRVLEGVSPAGVQRRVGWSVAPQVAAAALRGRLVGSNRFSTSVWQGDVLLSNDIFTNSSVYKQRSDQVSVGWAAEYHRPLGLRWQFDAQESFRYIAAIRYATLSNSLGLSWMIADRWLASATLSHQDEAYTPDSSPHTRHWFVGEVASLEYALEDSWSIGVQHSMLQDHANAFFNTAESLRFGLTRRFSGGFSAPGLAEPMRLSPPTN